jgi:hypothetical protein
MKVIGHEAVRRKCERVLSGGSQNLPDRQLDELRVLERSLSTIGGNRYKVLLQADAIVNRQSM